MAGDDEDKSSKTEEPTEQKLKKARQKGDVPSSKETGNMMVVFSLFMMTWFLLPQTGSELAEMMRRLLESAGQIGVATGSAGLSDLGAVIHELGASVIRAMAPVLGLMVAAALFGVLIQGETVVALERIKPKGSKLSPLGGLKKMFSPDSLVEFLKSTAKVAIIAVIATFVARQALTGIWQAPGFIPEHLPGYVRGAVAMMLILAAVLLVPIAIADIIWKRAQWIKKQRMSLKEVRDQHKESEGDPHLKAKRGEIRRKMSRQRIAVAVPTANVILTNPTHYAVALRYEMGRDQAPVCVAKGTDKIAAQIRRIARENEVPVVENRPLARALHAVVEIDDTIPVEHWQAVAEIIGYVMDLGRTGRRKPPEGSSLREED
ncbi:EscU/YscU/HrcU family type III secretion system export apparatus switch protein [Profundibacterium mesophilum]|uniref:Flagellar biosynthetic protein n=1 Tax=Profundibacterium mesophilum KAUST100406-0324 TaxID=1037889 RepID=A0A921TB18_9RHOB|nr:flagellar type III secretion system protein FlhB [Profundibacterium mesophilum]KAF0674625.1 Flagellar biosynthetic protein [Profundibacterium mesophilum KAUST100406-0324]